MNFTMNMGLLMAGSVAWSGVMVESAGLFLSATTPPPIEGSGVVQGTPIPGSPVLVEWSIVKRTDCPGKNSRVWDGQNGFHLTEELRATGLPTSEERRLYEIQTAVPAMAPPGDMTLTIRGYYLCPGASEVWFKMGPVEMEIAG